MDDSLSRTRPPLTRSWSCARADLPRLVSRSAVAAKSWSRCNRPQYSRRWSSPRRAPSSVSATTPGERQHCPRPASRSASPRLWLPTTCCARLPTFSLFRRDEQPGGASTAQGVSLRGIGPSGVSRTLVLLDGVPFNDPFGGWVYWTRVPLMSADRIEVVDGRRSSLYGNYAMGGVINIVTSRPTPGPLELQAAVRQPRQAESRFVCQRRLGKARRRRRGQRLPDRRISDRRRRASAARSTTTPPSNIDNVTCEVDYYPTDTCAAFVRGGYFEEERDNGKAAPSMATEANDTTLDDLERRRAGALPVKERSAGAHVRRHRNVAQQLSGGAGRRLPRSIGRMSPIRRCRRRRLAGWRSGTRLVRQRGMSSRRASTAGGSTVTARRMLLDGINAAQTVTLQRVSGGAQQKPWRLRAGRSIPLTQKLTLTLNARVDRWRNYDGHNLENDRASPAAARPTTAVAARTTMRSSVPRRGALYHADESRQRVGQLRHPGSARRH